MTIGYNPTRAAGSTEGLFSPGQVRTREVLREDADAGSAEEFARCLLPLPPLVEGDTVITCPSPLNVLKYTYDHSYY